MAERRNIVDALIARYARCATYRDEGTSRWAIRDAQSSIVADARFSTAFVREPFRFRFYLEETASSLLIHASDGVVRVVSSNRPLQSFRTLREAIKPTFGAAQGVLTIAVPLLLSWPETIFGRARQLEFEKDGNDIAITLDPRGAIAAVSSAWNGTVVVGGPTDVSQRTELRAQFDVPITADDLRFEAAARTRRLVN